MDGSLMTTLSRREIVNMQHAHFRGGYLYVIRDKVAADSDMAFIRIEVTPAIEGWRLRAAKLRLATRCRASRNLPERQRPTFHEIRGLGGRLMKRLGLSTEAISDLMAHSDPKTTQIYLELGPEAVTDEHFYKVRAPFSLDQLLAVK